MDYPFYKIYNVTNKVKVNKLISLTGLPLKETALRVEIDFMEESAVIYTDDLLIPIDYEKTKEILNAYL